MPKKKFIDKKHATTFVLGHRSQKDPLLADENAPQNILIPLDQVPDLSRGGISTAGAGGSSNAKGIDPEKRKEEQKKYGIYFDDDYDYLQHLKDSDEVSTIKWDVVERIYAPNYEPEKEVVESSSTTKYEDLENIKIKLPSSVFESEFREEVGLLNKAAPSFGPRPDLDPEVVAALDDDFDREDPENELEDNFIELANNGIEDKVLNREPTAEELEGLFSDDEEVYEDNEQEDESDYEDEEDDSLGSLNGGPAYSFGDEETKSQFTNYSMSSSVVRRNKQLLLVDDRFEKFFERYEDTEIGALDCDEIEGDINPESDLLLKYAEEFQKEKKQEDDFNDKIVSLALNEESASDNDTECSEDEQPKEKWDCQSIISTYSSTKNRPKMIKEPSKRNLIKVSTKTGIPVGVLGKGGLTKDNLKVLDHEYNEEHGTPDRAKTMMSGVTSIRSKNETSQERRERKQSVKEYRRERRLERKANTEAFKEEKKRHEKVRLNNKANVQGLKL
ncbi:Protein LTV1 [Orchesella cincta]|uniref:Protein LTV1 homolog n=1 Tax=Orchesella cincta TaxID=48709 RepID=A0A1D2NIZ6_ORCCI|nr:Protein LTV1 [Orchesella cincta]